MGKNFLDCFEVAVFRRIVAYMVVQAHLLFLKRQTHKKKLSKGVKLGNSLRVYVLVGYRNIALLHTELYFRLRGHCRRMVPPDALK